VGGKGADTGKADAFIKETMANLREVSGVKIE